VPGETKVWQYITLMKRIFLIDCPGVVYNRTDDSEAAIVLKGVVRVENLEDAAQYVPEVLQRVKPDYLVRPCLCGAHCVVPRMDGRALAHSYARGAWVWAVMSLQTNQSRYGHPSHVR
jgi:ribosome biogenesis GTPase A